MRLLGFIMFYVLATVTFVSAGSYNYIPAEDMKSKIETGSEVIIVDIQVEKEFKQHHLPGSVATYAYPVKTDAERAQIDQAIKIFEESGRDVVIICPRGAGGAKRTYDYLLMKNVPSEKVYILEKGIAGWPYPDLMEKG